jgi:hypothetical protein
MSRAAGPWTGRPAATFTTKNATREVPGLAFLAFQTAWR